jgi:TatD DNase family protein
MIIDVHAHLDLFDETELRKVLENAKNSGVEYIITNSVDLETAKKSLLLSKKDSIIKVALGIYPEDALSIERENFSKEDFIEFKKLVLENKKNVVAIGEIGMDFYHGKKENKKEQETLFREQLELAKKLDIPALIHTRGAEAEILEVLKDYSEVKKVLHCFCGNMKLVEKASKLGCYFSIPCSLERMQNFLELLKIAPQEKILTETDSPYLSPFKGKQNEPAFITETIKVISKIWKISEEETEKIIEENTLKVFSNL